MKRPSTPWETLLVATMVLIASVCAQSQAVSQELEAEEGKVVTIDADAVIMDLDDEEGVRVVEEPTYWIGVQGRSIESAVLRTHLQLAEDLGVVVEQVIDDSPAAKSGLRRHDIILRVNGDVVDNMQVLQTQVRAGKDKPLELKIIRLGNKENLVVVPEVRPKQLERPTNDSKGFNGNRLQGDIMQQLMRQLGNRNIGPGMVFRGGGGQAFNLNQMPNGVSVSIQRNNNEPAQITVKQGEKTWEIVGDDKESLKQLPADLRPFVERMLKGQGNAQAFGGMGDFNIDFGDINAELERVLPGGLGRFQRNRQPDRLGDPVLERMEQLERRLEELQNRLNQETE